MRVYEEEGIKVVLDFAGTIMFSKNESCITINNTTNVTVTIENVTINVVNTGFIDRLRQCITLYRFLKS